MSSRDSAPGRVAAIVDVHADADALSAVLSAIQEAEIETVWCLGDFASDGPDPVECFELVFEKCAVVLRGNHELFVCEEAWEHFQGGWAETARRAAAALGPDRIERLRQLPEHVLTAQAELVHGALTHPVGGFIDDPETAATNLRLLERQILLCGHTHRPASWALRGRVVSDSNPDRGSRETVPAELQAQARRILNPGAVVDPDGARWLEMRLDEDELGFTWH